MNIDKFRPLLASVALLGMSAVAPLALAAQQGTITGRVTDQATQQPVVGAQVLVTATNRGSVTDQDGRYRIENVAPGRVTILVRAIGYASASQAVTVADGATVELNFTVVASAVALDAVVVTATGEQRARELGNSVSTINAAGITPEAPVTNMSDLLNARAAGVTVLPSSGVTGSGTRVRIRGSNSVSLSNEPVIIVDGIRVENGASSNSVGVGGQVPSRLNDINPEDIESIEVIKGPSAAALYGTAAANGIIQVRTKRGRPGETRWTGWTEYGGISEITEWPANYRTFGTRVSDGAAVTCRLFTAATGSCTIDSVQSFNPLEVHTPFRSGFRQQYGLSVSGGSPVATYYVSGEWEDEKGVFKNNRLERLNLRANIRSQVRDNLDLMVSTGYVSSDLSLPDNDNNALGIVSSGLLGRTRDDTLASGRVTQGYGFLRPDESYFIETAQGVERYTGGVTMNWTPRTFLTARAVLGVDVTNRFDTRTFPPGKVPFNTTTFEGSRAANRIQIFNYTVNVNATAKYNLTPTITGNSTVGIQYFRDLNTGVFAFGRKLVAGAKSLSGTVVPTVDEATTENVTLGAFVEEQIGLNERLFFTAAVRGDDNSSFGNNFDFIAYPKFGASWVLSEEPFFPQLEWLSSLRVRAAYGQSGLQPGSVDALQFYNGVAVTADNVDVPGLTIGNLGNPELKPERSREIELGFDTDLLDNRARLEFTYYDKNSKDALIARQLAPSLGVSTSQFENLGEVSNKGVEISLSATVIERPNLRWEVQAGAWGNKNRLIELGKDIEPIIFGIGGASQRHEEGFPLGSYFIIPIESYSDADGDGFIDLSEVVLGADPVFRGIPFPSHGMTFSTTLSLGRYVRLYGLLDGRFGHSMFNSTEEFRCGFLICRGLNDPNASLAEQARAVAAGILGTEWGYVEKADFVKLREVSITLTAPEEWVRRLGVRGASLTLSGKNLATWTDYTGFDPEVNGGGQANFSTFEFLTQPPTRFFTARLNFNF